MGWFMGNLKEEEGAPAEALFRKVLENFEGELIELVDGNENEEADDQALEGDNERASGGGDFDDSGEKE